ncbi:MAG: hypothetical protein U0840_03840 [Gemmataceae bacterium]
MLILILLLLFVWVVLTLLLSAWSLWFQAYLYTESTPGIAWRGPAAGSAVMAIVLLWVVLAYGTPGRYRPLWEFSSSEDSKPFPELRVPTAAGKEEVYKLRPGTRVEYRLGGLSSGKLIPSRPPEIIVGEGADRAVFKPERDDKGKFKQRTTSAYGRESKEPLRYLDEKGRVMLEDSFGQLTSFQPGVFLLNLLLNALLLGVLFVALWPVLRFQWPHALGQAVVLWLILLLFVFPPLLTRTETVSRERAARAAG